MSLLPGQCQTQTLAAQLVFTTVGSPHRHPNLHRLFSATVESCLVFIASFVTDAWRSVGRHAMPPSLHVRRSLCTVLAQLFSPSGGCSWWSLSCCSVSCHLRRNPGRAGRNDAGVDSPTDGEKKKTRRQSQSKTIKVVIRYAANIPIQAITDAISVQNYQGSMQQSRAVSSFADPSTTAIQRIIRTYEVVFKAAEVSIQVSVPLKEVYL
ncbi:hypothetical protein PIB30_077740 [Stylosanthes scabra]|uniref:Uncharacterized protein n=1 Tax=Stylosanthes scabra TaxID=79078 RepID=A0ABU6USC1_9FABA|nr:hypothetical protein [Stylosanthes scabra]